MTTIDPMTQAPTPLPATPQPTVGSGSGNGNGNGRRRDELAAFLRARRARINPSDVGLPPGLRRRTPGLRREEVAQLAGIGITWYTWLEQGRPIHVSTQVLDAVARTLRLDRAEQEHLYRLAHVPAAPPEPPAADTVPPTVRQILDSLDPLPATLLNSRFDVLAANRTYAGLVGNWHTPSRERHRCNVLWCCLLEPAARERILNFDEEMARAVATLRAAFAEHLNEPSWTGFIRRLSAASPEFAALWARQEVARPSHRTKQFLDPVAGLLRLDVTSLAVADMPETRISVYTPADDATRERLPLTRRIADPS